MVDFAFKPHLEPGYSVEHEGRGEHWYGIKRGKEVLGHMAVGTDRDDPKTLKIKNIETKTKDLGPSGLRHISKQLKAFHPDAEYVSGRRISGARTSGEDERPFVVGKLR